MAVQCKAFSRFSVASLGAAAALVWAPTPARAIDVVLDFSFDTNDFFGSGNPNGAAGGAQALASINAAADFFSELLTDSFDPIVVPEPFTVTPPGFSGPTATSTFTWNLEFSNPSDGPSVSLPDASIGADEYRVYVGGQSFGGNVLGTGGPGGFSSSASFSAFTQEQIAEAQQINDDFNSAITTRGEASGFAGWGGVVSFDNDDSTNWHFDHLSEPSAGEADFFSVALHEIAHTLGFGVSPEWNALISDDIFTGSAATEVFGGPVPIEPGHVLEGTESTIRGTDIVQEVSLDPTITLGTRKLFTDLDVAVLEDLGWSIADLVEPTFITGDYNGDGFVGQQDLDLVLLNFGDTVLPDGFEEGALAGGLPFDNLIGQDELDGVLLNFGDGTAVASGSLSAVPEPATAALLLAGGVALTARRCRG